MTTPGKERTNNRSGQGELRRKRERVFFIGCVLKMHPGSRKSAKLFRLPKFITSGLHPTYSVPG